MESAVILKSMLKEQIFHLGKVFARHEVPDDVIWEVAKGFDQIYQKTRQEVVHAKTAHTHIHKLEPHPGLIYLLEKIER